MTPQQEKKQPGVTGLVMKKPPVDIGYGVYDNGRVWKVSLVFFDLLINLKEQEVLIGVGIPFYRAWCLHFQF